MSALATASKPWRKLIIGSTKKRLYAAKLIEGAEVPVVNAELGRDVRIFQPDLVNIYGCRIGDETRVGPFVEIQKGAEIGARCKISSHSFICEGVTIEDQVFVGHGVMFINDLEPKATTLDGELQGEGDWTLVTTRVRKGASIGSGAVIMGGITIGERAIVGAGAVVTKDVATDEVVAGVPARLLRTASIDR
jgi:acetyltransferase-like isoleucine patch superfamily enzyme